MTTLDGLSISRQLDVLERRIVDELGIEGMRPDHGEYLRRLVKAGRWRVPVAHLFPEVGYSTLLSRAERAGLWSPAEVIGYARAVFAARLLAEEGLTARQTAFLLNLSGPQTMTRWLRSAFGETATSFAATQTAARRLRWLATIVQEGDWPRFFPFGQEQGTRRARGAGDIHGDGGG